MKLTALRALSTFVPSPRLLLETSTAVGDDAAATIDKDTRAALQSPAATIAKLPTSRAMRVAAIVAVDAAETSPRAEQTAAILRVKHWGVHVKITQGSAWLALNRAQDGVKQSGRGMARAADEIRLLNRLNDAAQISVGSIEARDAVMRAVSTGSAANLSSLVAPRVVLVDANRCRSRCGRRVVVESMP